MLVDWAMGVDSILVLPLVLPVLLCDQPARRIFPECRAVGGLGSAQARVCLGGGLRHPTAFATWRFRLDGDDVDQMPQMVRRVGFPTVDEKHTLGQRVQPEKT